MFTYRELKSATNGFSLENLIGKGASGTVFRGILRDGKPVAVKKLDACSLQADREFQNELMIHGCIESPYVVDLVGYCVEKKHRLLVYEYMPNSSLQKLLFSDGGNECLSWEKRFQIIQNVANAIEFLHHGCDPPVIHGDVKPSNVLLDWDFRAKVSDFGLSRHKTQLGQFGMEIFSQDLGKSQDLLSGNLMSRSLKNEVDFTHKPLASSSSKNCKLFHDRDVMSPSNQDAKANENGCSPRGKEVVPPVLGGEESKKFFSYEEELWSIEHSKELEQSPSAIGDESGNPKQWGREWWWRQEESGELSSMDYVSEWIGSQICQPAANLDWADDEEDRMKGMNGFPLEVPQSGPVLDNGEQSDVEAGTQRPRKMQDCWKHEHLDDIIRKGSRRKSLESRIKKQRRFKKFFRSPHVHLDRCFHIFRQRIRLRGQNQINVANPNAELSFRRVWKRKKCRSMGSEMWSGDLFSRELSSTTSMRGTLCYVAPEYGGCGYLMEKADIYSLGVLVLVTVSGRRPLHVLNSPMKLEKANLISWCRQLAQAGNVLELVDERMGDAYDKEKATLCINVALACLQRMPELRPDIVDVVKILQGEKDLSSLHFELSPSPPSKLYSRSRRKLKSDAKA